ncbi:type II secretion system protein [Bacillaceae bacterium S4-13-56]
MKKKYKANGFTLIEILAVIVILGLIVAIAVPAYSNVVAKSKEDVCESNREEVKRMYHTDLTINGLDHSGFYFVDYLATYDGDVCPENGVMTYHDGVVNCSIHSEDLSNENDSNDGVGVPFF